MMVISGSTAGVFTSPRATTVFHLVSRSRICSTMFHGNIGERPHSISTSPTDWRSPCRIFPYSRFPERDRVGVSGRCCCEDVDAGGLCARPDLAGSLDRSGLLLCHGRSCSNCIGYAPNSKTLIPTVIGGGLLNSPDCDVHPIRSDQRKTGERRPGYHPAQSPDAPAPHRTEGAVPLRSCRPILCTHTDSEPGPLGPPRPWH